MAEVYCKRQRQEKEKQNRENLILELHRGDYDVSDFNMESTGDTFFG